ncbi:hypothetical protein NKH60_31160 [Mesorhizobium sp. M1006]|uniref:hypothetical protein n=1 Tax=Mesorhizobium sp. M1006 TaxID=2957048 RepID=UPI003336807B
MLHAQVNPDHGFCWKRGHIHLTRQVTAMWPNGKQEHYRLRRFADLASAEPFKDHFGGVMFDPKRDRENGRARGAWHGKRPKWNYNTAAAPTDEPYLNVPLEGSRRHAAFSNALR